MRKFHKRQYTPKHPEKYEGDLNTIVMRSSWETRFALWCESNSGVLAWSSEEVIIPYVSPLDGKAHRYFVDFKIKVPSKAGIVTYLVEVKPFAQTQVPISKRGKRKSAYKLECETYLVNQAKWKAAIDYCDRRGWKFKIITEYELGLKG